MPQIQVIPSSEGRYSVGETIAGGLLSGLSQGLSQSLTGMLETKRNAKTARALADHLKIPKDEKSAFIEAFKSVPSDRQAETLNVLSQAKERHEKAEATKAKSQLFEKGNQDFQKVYNDMVDTFKSGELGMFGAQPWSKKNRITRARFDALRPKMYSAIRKMEQSGHVTKETIQQINKSIPNASDLDSTIEGKLEALAQTLDLDPSALTGEMNSRQSPEKAQGPVQLKQVPPGTPLQDQAVAAEILKQAKGDKEQARMLAKQMGYEL